MASRRVRRLIVGGSTALLAAPISAAAASPAASRSASAPKQPVVVVSGLNNPRQLSLLHNDVLLVGEAGKGGRVKIINDPEGGKNGLGYTGSISAVLSPAVAHNQRPHRVVKGLLSAASAEVQGDLPVGSFALGPDGVSARSLNRIGIIETTFEPATPRKARPFDGHLLLTSPYGPIRPRADIARYEARHDPDHQGVESDPYGVLAYRSGWLVADAAGNTVYRVGRHGHIWVFHVFHNVTTGKCAQQSDPTPKFPGCNFVPTSLVADASGNVYVGGLSSLTPGEAQVVKLDSRGHVLKVWHGFTAVTGLALGGDGSLYVSQLFAHEAHPPIRQIQGVVTRISAGHRTNMDVPFPAGLAVDRQNNVYVSAFSVLPGTGAGIPGIDTSGQVWRIRFWPSS